MQENILGKRTGGNRDFTEGATSHFCQGFRYASEAEPWSSVHPRSTTVPSARVGDYVNDREAARFPARAKIAEREIGTRDLQARCRTKSQNSIYYPRTVASVRQINIALRYFTRNARYSLGAQSTAADAGLETVHYPAEFRFLTHVPPNAIRTPVMFVSSDGILDETCGLTLDCPYDY